MTKKRYRIEFEDFWGVWNTLEPGCLTGPADKVTGLTKKQAEDTIAKRMREFGSPREWYRIVEDS